MKIPELKGCGTALATPFLADGEVDYEAYAALVRRQVEAVARGGVGEPFPELSVGFGAHPRSPTNSS